MFHREDLVAYFEGIMGLSKESEESCQLEDKKSLPNGWRIIKDDSGCTYYVHLESSTVQLSPPKSGIVPGLHRQLCHDLVVKLIDLELTFLFYCFN